MIAAGLSWRMAIGACVLGNFIMGLVITMNGRIGATVSRASLWLGSQTNFHQLHVPFPILARMPFGYYFSYFVVVSRCALAIIWLG
jgi:NCS1 family nucleobase:cation symporter-1